MCMRARSCVCFCCMAVRLKIQELAHRMPGEMQKWQRAEGNTDSPEIIFHQPDKCRHFFLCRRFLDSALQNMHSCMPSQTKKGNSKPTGSKVICVVRYFFFLSSPCFALTVQWLISLFICCTSDDSWKKIACFCRCQAASSTGPRALQLEQKMDVQSRSAPCKRWSCNICQPSFRWCCVTAAMER